MEDWDLEDLWEWEELADYQGFLSEATVLLAEQVFLSDGDFLPDAGEDYSLGYLEPEAWWPLVNQLSRMVDLPIVLEQLNGLVRLLNLPGIPSEVLETPLSFLATALGGNLPREPSGRRVGSPKLVKIAQHVVGLVQEFPNTAQAAVQAWASVHRSMLAPPDLYEYSEQDLAELLFAADLPAPVTGFSILIGLTLIRWPERAEGLPLPPGFLEPDLEDELLAQWETLPESPPVTEEGAGEAEALFAQGQLAHMLAQMGTMELLTADDPEEIGEQDLTLSYSRLSRAVLWIHHHCRRCPERDGVACKVAASWPERPAPLLDVAGEIASTGRILGCIKMQEDQDE